MSQESPSGSSTTVNKRRVPRHTLIAAAEIFDHATESRTDARVSEISLYGCYVDALNTLPPGSVVSIKILRDSGPFETTAIVLYAQSNLGMGFAFTETTDDQRAVLENWLIQLAK